MTSSCMGRLDDRKIRSEGDEEEGEDLDHVCTVEVCKC